MPVRDITSYAEFKNLTNIGLSVIKYSAQWW